MAETDYDAIIRAGRIGEKGDKGDAGIGWNLTSITATTDLNNLKTPGIYSSNLSSIELTYAAGQALNYPPISAAAWNNGLGRGAVAVYPWQAGQVQQEYKTLASNTVPEMVFRRTGYANSWSKWYVYTSQRVDNTAGRAIYTWDDTANREQLIYGDTGKRAMNSIINPEFGITLAKLRRTLNDVEFQIQLNKPSGLVGSKILILTDVMPVGFRNQHTIVDGAGGTSGTQYTLEYMGGGLSIGNVQTAASSIFIHLKYSTTDVWPTSLPGTAE